MDIRGNPVLPGGRCLNHRLAGLWNVTAFAIGGSGRFWERRAKRSLRAGQYNPDISHFKTARITERAPAGFRWELFNALNRPRTGDPNTLLSSSSFGKITSATAPRIMLVGMKILF